MDYQEGPNLSKAALEEFARVDVEAKRYGEWLKTATPEQILEGLMRSTNTSHDVRVRAAISLMGLPKRRRK